MHDTVSRLTMSPRHACLVSRSRSNAHAHAQTEEELLSAWPEVMEEVMVLINSEQEMLEQFTDAFGPIIGYNGPQTDRMIKPEPQMVSDVTPP